MLEITPGWGEAAHKHHLIFSLGINAFRTPTERLPQVLNVGVLACETSRVQLLGDSKIQPTLYFVFGALLVDQELSSVVECCPLKTGMEFKNQPSKILPNIYFVLGLC